MVLQWNLENKELHKEYVKLCDDEFEIYFNGIVQNILAFSKIKVLTISGPTSSGKTTTALKLGADLKKHNVKTKIISMDNFYKDRDDIPKKTDGTQDFETIEALDTALLIKCLSEAIDHNKTKLPKYSFRTGSRKSEWTDFELGEKDIIIIEGMHGLNPMIIDSLPIESVRSIYTNIGEKVYMPKDVIFSKRDIRLLRRLIRDYKYRGASPEFTFLLWDGVRKSEELYIFPYENNAHIKINSIYQYELNVIKSQALNLLAEIKENSSYYEKAQELTDKLSNVISINEEFVPGRSLIREFIGDSEYYYK